MCQVISQQPPRKKTMGGSSMTTYHLSLTMKFFQISMIRIGKKAKTGHWCEAFHGTNLAALYSILATGMIKESTTAEDGDRFFPTSPGAYCPGYDHESQKKINDVRRKAVGYLTYWSPLDEIGRAHV